MGESTDFTTFIEAEFSTGTWKDFAEGRNVELKGRHLRGEDYLKYMGALQGTWFQDLVSGNVGRGPYRPTRGAKAQGRILNAGDITLRGNLSDGFLWELKGEVLEFTIPFDFPLPPEIKG